MNPAHLEHLSKDKKLWKVIQGQEPCVLAKRKNVYLHLCSSIISQQLSVKVAAVIYKRFLDLFESQAPTPAEILAVPFDELRAIGLSNSKTHYIRNVCEFFMEEKLTDKRIYAMTSDEVLEKLTQIKGVGKWTVEMLLLFTLGYEDVFAVDDLGIQQAMIRLYKLDPADKRKLRTDMERLSRKWSPYRSYVCRYFWGWKDTP